MARFLNSFALTSAILFSIVAVILVAGYREAAMEGVVKATDRRNGTVAQVLTGMLRPQILLIAGSTESGRTPAKLRPATRALHRAIEGLQSGPGPTSVRLLSPLGLPVYASDGVPLGEAAELEGDALASLLRGETLSALVPADADGGAQGDEAAPLAVESHIPLRALDGAVAGVMQIRTDATAELQRVGDTTLKLALGTVAAFALLYCALLLAVRRICKNLWERNWTLDRDATLARSRNRELERRIVERWEAEQSLQDLNLLLESRVERRTNELLAENAERRRAEATLRKLHLAVEQSPASVVITDTEANIEYVNPTFERVTGYAAGDVLGQNPRFLRSGRTPNDVYEEMWQRLAAGQGWQGDLCNKKKGGEIYWEHASISPIKAEDGTITHYVAVKEDITSRRRAEETLRKLSRAVEQSPASVIITDTDGRIEYVNPTFEQVTGYASPEVLGQNPRILRSGHTPRQVYEVMWQRLTAGLEWRGELCNRKRNGEIYWEHASIAPIKGEDGTISHFVAVKEDITVRRQYEQQLVRQATHDHLTQLPNRVLLLDRLAQAIATSKRGSRSVALLFIDLDHFKNVNDSFGHLVGDRVLLEAAARLTQSVRSSDTISRLGDEAVARLGGDEFVIILPDLSEASQAEIVARRILQSLSAPCVIDGHEFFLSASIGITVSPKDGEDPMILLRNADSAMYKAKDEGRNTYRYFTAALNSVAVERLEMESLLRRAVPRSELDLNFQPIVDVPTGTVVGAEALLRWHCPSLGLVPPDRFIPLAEETGLIVEIGAWVVQAACRQLKAWEDGGIDLTYLSVNLSSRQFREAGLQENLAQALDQWGLSPDRLDLEITESLVMDDVPRTVEILESLHAAGHRLSMDDFGTGYSSLSYLKRFPIDALKIDRCFIAEVNDNADDAALVTAIIAMAKALRLTTVAEGVETTAHLEFLQGLGCDRAQGYLIGRPMPADAFADWVKDRRASAAA